MHLLFFFFVRYLSFPTCLSCTCIYRQYWILLLSHFTYACLHFFLVTETILPFKTMTYISQIFIFLRWEWQPLVLLHKNKSSTVVVAEITILIQVAPYTVLILPSVNYYYCMHTLLACVEWQNNQHNWTRSVKRGPQLVIHCNWVVNVVSPFNLWLGVMWRW